MANENIQELKFQVGEAWKGVYSSSTAYGLANVVQDPTGLSIYRSLKSGNVGHPLSNASWWFRIIDLSSIKAESDRIAALNQAIAQDEALRVAAEELRQQHEAERVAAETQRNEAEQQRISAEEQRVNKESQREAAEQQRITAEQGRVSAESARVQAEQARVLAETLRANAEDQRAANEQNRIAAEQQRIERAEQDHQRAESDHATYVDSLGAFDISSYHATDGVLAKYADLTAALGTNGANIPDDLRKGGMSVKFVQSSDNKYVQYRLMSDTFNTTPANWQGIDVEPSANDNLVEGKGIVRSIGNLKGSAQLSASSFSDAINCYIKTGDKFDVNISTDVAISKLIITANGKNSQNRILNKTFSPAVTSYSQEITTAIDISVIYLYMESAESTINAEYSFATGIKKELNDVNKSLSDLSESIATTNNAVSANTANLKSIGAFNVNRYLNQDTAFASRSAARLAVPASLRYYGLTITYYVKDGEADGQDVNIWITESYRHMRRLTDSYWESNNYWHAVENPIINISALYPTGGIDGTNVFNHGDARGYVMPQDRYQGVIITYLSRKGWKTEQFVGTNWSVENEYWKPLYEYDDSSIIKLTGEINDLSSHIHWNDGYFRKLNGNLQSSGGYRYSNGFHVERGDVIIIKTSRGIDATIPVMFKSLSNDKPYHPVLWGGLTEYRYVANEGCYITLNAFTEAKDSEQSFVWIKNEIENDYYSDEEFTSFYPAKEIVPVLANLNKAYTNGGTVYAKPITFLHLSDIHNGLDNYMRILQFKDKYKKYLGQNYINDVILSGDIAGQNYQAFDTHFLTVDRSILWVLGNHDTYKYYVTFTVSGVTNAPSVGDVYKIDTLTYTVDEVNISSGAGTIKCIQSGGNISSTTGTITKDSGLGDDTITYTNAVESSAPRKACYDRYMSNIANWGVVQPANAASVGKNYYYKDYTEGNNTVLRLVVVDCMFWDEDQATWLTSVLDDAKANGIPVIGSQHFPLHNDANKVNKVLCPFSSKQDDKFYINGELLWNGSVDIVDSFISDGGQFVCWLCGHMHFDMTYWLQDHPNQLWLSIASAGGEGTWADHAWVYDTKAWDLFNMVSVDVYKKWVKVARIGCEYNIAMQKADVITLDWNNYSDSSYTFDAANTYRAGSICNKDGKIYKFKFLHSGAWDSEDVELYDRVID